MIQELSETEQHTFVLPNVLYKGADVVAYAIEKMPKKEVSDAREVFELLNYEDGRPTLIVKEMACRGFFDGLMSNKSIRLAKKKGTLPQGYQVHHIVPLKLGGSNDPKNLCIVDSQTHAMLHQFIYQPLMDKLEVGEKATLILPEFKRVMGPEDRTRFFLYSEIRKFSYRNGLLPVKVKKNNCNADMGFRDAYCQSGRGCK